jgi:hypothetical protein
MRGAIHPLPQYAFIAWCSVKRRDTFTFTLPFVVVVVVIIIIIILLFIPLSLRPEHRASTVPRHPRLLFQFLGSVRHLVGLLGGRSVQRKASTYTGQHNTERRR